MVKRLAIAAIAVLVTGAVFAQAYRWVDEDGVVHYSDRPEPGAEPVDLPTTRPPSRPSRIAAPPSRPIRPQAVAPAEEPDEPFRYRTLEISQPIAEETLWNIGGVLNVSLSLQPGLQRGHRVRVYFDGTPQMVDSTSFQLEEVYRGEHNLQAEVLDETGKLLIRSETTRFYVQQTTVIGGG